MKIKLYTRTGLLLATGYERIVFGGRGAYVELKEEQIVHDHIHLITYIRHIYFHEYRSNDKANVMVYLQRRTIGYADYKVGLYYIAPSDLRDRKTA